MTTVDEFLKTIKSDVKKATQYQYFFYNHETRGVRMFRVNDRTDTAITIVLNPGEIRRGRSNNIGIYAIDRMSIFSNYGYGNYLKPVDKKSWDKGFKLVLQLLM